MRIGEIGAYLSQRLHGIAGACFCLLGFGMCLSEPFSRNCVRAILLLLLYFCVRQREAALRAIAPYRRMIALLASVMLVLACSSWYGGTLAEMLDTNAFIYQYSLLLVPAACVFIGTRAQSCRVLDMCFLSLAALDIFIFWQAYHGVDRPISPMGGSFMQTAMFYVILLPMLLVRAMDPGCGQRRRIAYFALLAGSVVAFLQTNTRGAWLAVLPPVFYILACHRWLARQRAMAVLLVALLVSGMFLCAPKFAERVGTIGDMRNQSQSERILMYQSAFRMIQDHPVFGVGLGNYQSQYLAHYILPDAKERNHIHTHNVYLQFAIDAGIFGIGSYGALCGYILLWSWRRRRNAWGMMLLTSTGALVLYGMTDYTFAGHGAMRLYYLMLGVCAKASELSEGSGDSPC